MARKNWKDMDIYNLLVRMDRGHIPSATEKEVLAGRRSLNLSGTQITALPESIGELTALNSLNLSGTGIAALPESIGKLKALESLDLRRTRIATLPESIGELKALKGLYLGSTRIAALPESIGGLTALKSLNLSSTRIARLPESIGKLWELESLDLHITQITVLPESIFELAALETLYLGGTPIAALPESIGNLTALKTLYIGYTPIAALPESIGKLKALESLSLLGTRIATLPESIEKLTALENLYLGGTRIAALPESIGELTALKSLDLGGTRIAALPECIGELPNLRHLDLVGLKLDMIPRSLGLKGLPFVDKEQLNYIETGVNLHGVTLSKQDVSIFLETPTLIPSLYEDDKVTLRECKVIFLGDGEVGKSYTILRINNKGRKETDSKPYLTKQTHGVEIKDWPVGGESGFMIHFWDFGGQELLHSMHRCFLTDNTCYLVMVKSRKNEGTDRARFWLENIKEFAPNSPIILMVNIWGNADGERVIDESRLISDYENIRKVIYCSAKDAVDAEFREKVMASIESTVREAGFDKRETSRNWLNICKKIKALSDDKPFLTKVEYHKLCAENQIKDENASDLLTFFNNIGVCFSYHRDREKKELTDYRLLKPIWLTNAVYAIIEEGMVHAQKGVISMESIGQMLCNEAPAKVRGKEHRRTAPEIRYKEDQLECIIDVAEANELCFRIGDGSVFFPALLKDNTPDDAIARPGDEENQAEYRFIYNYLPDSVVHRLMIRLKKDNVVITEPWFKGMVLGAMGGHKAIIRMEGDKTLRVQVVSEKGRPTSEFFPLIRNEILNVNRALGLSAREAIAKGDDVFTVKNLRNTYRRGQTELSGSVTDEVYNVFDLLNSFFEKAVIDGMDVDENGRAITTIYHYHKKEDPILRKALYNVYNGKCAYCGTILLRETDMQVDHILPSRPDKDEIKGYETKMYLAALEAKGFGLDKPDYIENYLPCCGHCNGKAGKSNKTFELNTLRFFHDKALKKAPEVIALMDEYKQTKKK